MNGRAIAIRFVWVKLKNGYIQIQVPHNINVISGLLRLPQRLIAYVSQKTVHISLSTIIPYLHAGIRS